MNERHLHIVEPPDIDEDDDGGGGGDEDVLVIDASVNGDSIYLGRVVLLEEDVTPEAVAKAMLSAMRGAVAAFDPAVHMAFERLLIHEGGTA